MAGLRIRSPREAFRRSSRYVATPPFLTNPRANRSALKRPLLLTCVQLALTFGPQIAILVAGPMLRASGADDGTQHADARGVSSRQQRKRVAGRRSLPVEGNNNATSGKNRENGKVQVCDSMLFMASERAAPATGGRSDTTFGQGELCRQILETLRQSAATTVLLERQPGILGRHQAVVRRRSGTSSC